MPASNVIRLPTTSTLSGDDCRLLVESVVDYAIFMLDPDGTVITWNPGAERIKGYSATEIVGQHFSKFYPPEEIEAGTPARALRVAAETGRFEAEGWRLRKDGTRFWASVVISALRSESGVLRGYGKVTRDLTDRNAVEERLRRSEERFHHLVDAVVDYAIFMLDETGRVATWNSGAHRLKGYASEEILGRHFSCFYTAEDRAAGKPERVLDTVRQHGRYEEEGWRVRKDGRPFWANVVVTALRDEHGHLAGFAKVTRDLTARREAEERERHLLRAQAAREAAERSGQLLRDSEARYRALSARLEAVLEGVADGITLQDPDGRLVFANTAAAHLCGFGSVDELMRTPFDEVVARFEILDTEGKPMRSDELPSRRVLAGAASTSALLHILPRDGGAELWVRVRAKGVRTADGDGELALNIWHDVTLERRAELEARYLSDATAALGTSLEQREMLSALGGVLVPGLGDWCSTYLVDGDVLRDVTVHGDPAKQHLADEYRRRFPADADHAGATWSVVRTGEARILNDIGEGTLRQSTADPEALEVLRALGVRGALLVPIRMRSRILGAIALVNAQPRRRYDATDLALLQEIARRTAVALENARLYRHAQSSAKAAEEASRAKDEFLATVSHELRTPLSAILGWSTVLKDRLRDPAVLKPAEVIHRNAQAQLRIIEDILDVARVITGKLRIDPRPTDLVAICRDAIEVVRPSADAKRLTIELSAEDSVCVLAGDPERLQQVVWNLLSNAVKFTGAGGRIRLHVGREGSSCVLRVTDTGAGIDPAFLPAVFDRFQQADPSTTRRVGGLGLGLALVRHIVELHGGSVRASSDGLGKGATFTIRLPVRAVAPSGAIGPDERRHDEAERKARRVSLGDPGVDLAGVRVLVVDDEPDARELVTVVLVDAGAVVETAGSAAAAYEAFKRFRPDVLVSDIGMPDEDGLSFIRRIRALPERDGGRIPSLALTAYAREADRTNALRAGYTTHVGKPVDPRALASAVANLSRIRHRSGH